MIELTTHINWAFPSHEQVLKIAADVETGMMGQPKNAETESKYVKEIRRRMTELVVVEICDYARL